MSKWPSTKARKVYRALLKIGWKPKPGTGSSHLQLTHPERSDYTWAFHDSEEIGPVMLSRIAKHTGLKSEDLWENPFHNSDFRPDGGKGMTQKDIEVVRQRTSGKGKVVQSEQSLLDEAQDLCFDAWEISSPVERVRLAKMALRISSECADAYVILANEAKSPRRRAQLYSDGVKAGERALGSQAFREDAGRFWGRTGTRPYMRARFGLAQSLWEIGRHDEAIEHCSEMLQLNPNDNQGVRYVLVRYLLEQDRDSDAADIMNFYEDDMFTNSAYTRLLLTFRKEGDSEEVRNLLWSAVKCNYHVPAYLFGKKPLPRVLPDEFTLGYESEAVCYAASNLTVWAKTPGALKWLAKRLKWDSYE